MTLGRSSMVMVLFETYYDAAGRGLLFDILTREEYTEYSGYHGLPMASWWRSLARLFSTIPRADYLAMRPGLA